MACKDDLIAANEIIQTLRARVDALQADKADLRDRLDKLRAKIEKDAKDMRIKRANVGRQVRHGKGSN